MSADEGRLGRFDFGDFKINEGSIFDLVYELPYPVGLNSSYPEEFIRRVFSASASYMMRNKSIDHTRRRYGSEFQIEKKPPIRAAIENLISNCDTLATHFIDSERDSRIEATHAGLVLFDIYSYRAFDSAQAAAMLATHGFFGETLSILRHLIEQISWLSVIVLLADDAKISNTRAEGCIARAKCIFPQIGEIYGILSEASHFRFEHHARHYDYSDGRISSVRRSPRFAACGFVATVVCLAYLVNLTIAVVNSQYQKFNVPSEIVTLYRAIRAYFQPSDDVFIKRMLRASVDIDVEFRPWKHPILKLDNSSTHE